VPHWRLRNRRSEARIWRIHVGSDTKITLGHAVHGASARPKGPTLVIHMDETAEGQKHVVSLAIIYEIGAMSSLLPFSIYPHGTFGPRAARFIVATMKSIIKIQRLLAFLAHLSFLRFSSCIELLQTSMVRVLFS